MTTTSQMSESDRAAAPVAERKGQRTRRTILETARVVFADVGYERATIRGIAAAAGVDKSSVIKYFGTKEALFREAVYWDIPIADLATDDAAETPQNYARAMLTAWAADPNSPMAVLLRTSMTSDTAADILRRHISAQAIDAVSASIDAPDARLRTALAGAMLMGIASQRFILRIPDLADADIEEILRLITPALQSLIGPQESRSQVAEDYIERRTGIPAGRRED